MKLYRIDAPHFCAGLEIEEKIEYLNPYHYSIYKVVRAAPKIKYMLGWTRNKVTKYCKKKGWKLDEIPEEIEEVVDMV